MPQPPRKKARLSRDEEEEEEVTELPEDGEDEEEAPVGDDEDEEDGDFAGGNDSEGNDSEEDGEAASPNLYDVLGVEKTATADEIKRAYRKSALACHPDRNSDEDATAEFQLVNQAYAVLSNPARRRRYDQTGEVDEDPILFANKTAGQTWEDYFKVMFVSVTGEAIKDFAAKYRESDEEKQDVLKYYEEFEGDMEQVLENVMLSTEDDYERFCKIISDAIKAKKVKDYPEFHNKLSFDKDAIAAEADAAQQALDQIEQQKMMRDLKKEIAVRGKQKFDNLVNNLMDKYKDDDDEDDEDREEIDDAAFAKTQTQILGKRKRGAQ